MTRVALKDDGGKITVNPIKLDSNGIPVYTPEPGFAFSTFFGVRYARKNEPLITWTLAKDREKANLWTPVGGGEVDFINKEQLEVGAILDFSWNARQECLEESGVQVEVWGTGPFWVATIPHSYSHFTATMTDTKRDDKDPYRQVVIQGAHAICYYYMGKILGKPRLNDKPGPEFIYRNVAIKELSIEDSFAAFQKGEMNAYDTIKEAFIRFAWILKNPGMSPYLVPYDEDWAEKADLIQRPWKSKTVTWPFHKKSPGLKI